MKTAIVIAAILFIIIVLAVIAGRQPGMYYLLYKTPGVSLASNHDFLAKGGSGKVPKISEISTLGALRAYIKDSDFPNSTYAALTLPDQDGNVYITVGDKPTGGSWIWRSTMISSDNSDLKFGVKPDSGFSKVDLGGNTTWTIYRL